MKMCNKNFFSVLKINCSILAVLENVYLGKKLLYSPVEILHYNNNEICLFCVDLYNFFTLNLSNMYGSILCCKKPSIQAKKIFFRKNNSLNKLIN